MPAGTKTVLIGHSLGGQLNSIFAGLHPARVAALVSLSSVWIHFRELGRLRTQLGAFVFYLLMRTLALVLGYAPGDKIGWGARFTRQQIMDGSSWGLGGEALSRVALPTLAISFSDDLTLGPKVACGRSHLAPGVFDFLRKKHADLDPFGPSSVDIDKGAILLHGGGSRP